MADLDDVTEGYRIAWNDCRQARLHPDDTSHVAPEAYLGRECGTDKTSAATRAQFVGKRQAAEDFLSMEAACKALGITPDYSA